MATALCKCVSRKINIGAWRTYHLIIHNRIVYICPDVLFTLNGMRLAGGRAHGVTHRQLADDDTFARLFSLGHLANTRLPGISSILHHFSIIQFSNIMNKFMSAESMCRARCAVCCKRKCYGKNRRRHGTFDCVHMSNVHVHVFVL